MTLRDYFQSKSAGVQPTSSPADLPSGLGGLDFSKGTQPKVMGPGQQHAMIDRYDMAMQMLQAAMTGAQGSNNPALAFLTPLASGLVGKGIANKKGEMKGSAEQEATDAILNAMLPPGSRTAPSVSYGTMQGGSKSEAVPKAKTGIIGPHGGNSYGRPAADVGVSGANGELSFPAGTGGIAGRIKSGLIERGLAPHVADAFVLNFKDESGLNPGINEKSPLVPGSRGGFGLYQLTGPRRVAYETYAKSRGVPLDDIDAQLDFMMEELKGPEARAAQYILSSKDTPQAAAAIVNHFLRPAEQHRSAREKRYLAGQGIGSSDGTQGQGYDADSARQLMGVISNPNVSEAQRTMAQTLLTRLTTPADPLAAIEQETAQLELERLRNPVADPLKDAPEGTMWAEPGNPSAGVVPIPGTQPKPGWRRATPEEAAAYGVTAGQFGPDNKFHAINPPSGMSVETGPDGITRIVQGPGAGSQKPFTEGQSKDNVYATRARGALDKLESPQDPNNPLAGDVSAELGNLRDNLANRIPLFGNYMTSDGFQVARTAADEFLQAILRKDTGAAITEQEQALYGATYLPQPGDSPARLAYKKEARRRAVEAIEAGMSVAQLEAVTRAEKETLDAIGGNQLPADSQSTDLPQPTQALPDGLTEDDLRYLESD